LTTCSTQQERRISIALRNFEQTILWLYHALDMFLYEADYQTNIDVCKKKTEEAKSETAADAEIDLLQQELEEEIKKEHLLMDELR